MLRRFLLSTALPLALMSAGYIDAHAEVVVVEGVNGPNDVNGVGGPGGNGGWRYSDSGNAASVLTTPVQISGVGRAT
jgi:hypothetical protein